MRPRLTSSGAPDRDTVVAGLLPRFGMLMPGGEGMIDQRRHRHFWSAEGVVVPRERPRPIEAVMMAAVTLLCVIATNALV